MGMDNLGMKIKLHILRHTAGETFMHASSTLTSVCVAISTLHICPVLAHTQELTPIYYLVRSRHSSWPYIRNHWSVRATTHSSPERLMTRFSGSLYRMACSDLIISSLMTVLTFWTCRRLAPKHGQRQNMAKRRFAAGARVVCMKCQQDAVLRAGCSP